MTMTTFDRRMTRRSIHANARVSSRDFEKAKLLELLRQARVHVVEVRHADHRRQHDADEAALFVRVHGVVPLAQRRAGWPSAQSRDRAALSPTTGRCRTSCTKGGRRHRKIVRPGSDDILAEGIGHEIDRVTQLEQGADAMVFAERRPPRLEERLGGDHQDLHACGS